MIYTACGPKEAKYTFFSNADRIFSKIDHMIGHKTSLNKFKKIEIISNIFSDHKELNIETNHKEKNSKTPNSRRLNIMQLHKEWIQNEINEENKKFLEPKEINSQQSKMYGIQQNSPDRKVHSDTDLPK